VRKVENQKASGIGAKPVRKGRIRTKANIWEKEIINNYCALQKKEKKKIGRMNRCDEAPKILVPRLNLNTS
jgi:hypothetical protein